MCKDGSGWQRGSPVSYTHLDVYKRQIFIFAKEKGDGMTRFYDLRKVEPEKLKSLPEIYRKSGPVCTLNRTILSQHQYILSTEEYLGEEKVDERALLSRERVLRRRLAQLSEKIPSVYENEPVSYTHLTSIAPKAKKQPAENRKISKRKLPDAKISLHIRQFAVSDQERSLSLSTDSSSTSFSCSRIFSNIS